MVYFYLAFCGMGMDPNSVGQKTKKHSDLSAIPCYSIANIVAWTSDRCNQLFTHPINFYSSLQQPGSIHIWTISESATKPKRTTMRTTIR